MFGKRSEAAGVAVTAAVQTDAGRFEARIPLDVIHNEQVQQSVVVVVKPARRDGPHLAALVQGAAQARFRGDVRERAVAIIVKELIPIDVGHKQVGPAVIVVVPHRHAHPIACSGHSGALGDVRERSIAVVVEQAVVILRARFHQRRHLGAVDQVNVEQTVSVVVEQRNAGGHGFRLVLLRGRAVLRHKMHAGFWSDVLERDVRCRAPVRLGARGSGRLLN